MAKRDAYEGTMLDTRIPYGAKECTAEILITASERLGRPIKRGVDGWDYMGIADAVADVCINNAQGACDALKVLHEQSGAECLRTWSSGQTNYQLASFMRECARKVLR